MTSGNPVRLKPLAIRQGPDGVLTRLENPMAVNPFTKETSGKLNKLLAACMETRQYFQDCKDCGLEVDKEIADNEEQIRVCEGLKRKFFARKP